MTLVWMLQQISPKVIVIPEAAKRLSGISLEAGLMFEPKVFAVYIMTNMLRSVF